MKKRSFILSLHGTTIAIFMVINMLIEKYVYTFLESNINLSWLSAIIDFIISGFLYAAIYVVIYFSHKLLLIKITKKIKNIKGTWYHVHVKRNADGEIVTNRLRAGITQVEQDLYDLQFYGKNFSYLLGEDGRLEKVDSINTNTEWNSWTVDWDGGKELVTCFRAKSVETDENVYDNRHGIHRLSVDEDAQKMRGTFADEYPSSNFGNIYFFRSETEMENFIKEKLKGYKKIEDEHAKKATETAEREGA